MHGFFDKVACVAVGRARSAKAREGASDIHLERFALGVFFMLPNLSCGAGGRPELLRRTSRFGGLPDLYSFYCCVCDEWHVRKAKHCIGLAQLWQRGGMGADLLVYLSSMTRSPTKNASCHSDVVRVHYCRVANSLTFGKTSLGRRGS